jgi:uncharacterized phage protein (TIGR01671 family)
MREIKFRGKRVDGKGFAYGDLIHGVNHKIGKIYILPIKGGVQPLNSGIDPIDGWEVIPKTVGQYTGLKDKDGKEIYEGDVCKLFTDTPTEILYNNGAFGYNSYCGGTFISFAENNWFKWVGCNSDQITVIGNIHDNPELLTN